MALHLGKHSESQEKRVVGQLRRTQLITTFGSGSIVDMPDYSVIIAATNYWREDSPILHEPNLEKLLRVSCFRQPYVSGETDEGYRPDIPAFRFPIMHFCPKCGRLMPYWGFSNNKCPKCNREIVPSRFIAACINGHLEDFPYWWWVHRGDFSECQPNDHEGYLRISFSGETGGLDGITITCEKCHKSRSMAGCLGRDALKGYHCRGKRPWVGIKAEHNDPVPCNATLRGLLRGAANVYFSQTVSALTIPPWSNILNQEIDKKWETLTSHLDKPDNELRIYIDGLFSDFIKEKHYSVGDILREIRNRQHGNSDEQHYSKQDLYEDEYQVFALRNYEKPDDYQFRIESVDVPNVLSDYIEDVIMVKRLREVLALKGFRRISPEKPAKDDERFKGYQLKGDCVPLSATPLNWCPGVEMLGEGIFIKLKEEALSAWEKRNIRYYDPMKKRLEASNVECENFSPRYVLLHTLSHLLIRQLSVECGYSGASIKERIYSTYPNSDYKMAGMLLYTSSSDSDGSLGGLVRNALPDTFERVFLNLLQEASWCSSDPICIESKAQGYDSLNYAACHACTLLPETSCEMRNCLLDRGAVVGSIEDRARGFFGKLIR